MGLLFVLSLMKGHFMDYVVLIEDHDAEYSVERLANTLSSVEFGISGQISHCADNIQQTKDEIQLAVATWLNKWHDTYFDDFDDESVEPSPVSIDTVLTVDEYIKGLNANTILPPSKAHGRYVALVKTI